MRNNSEKASVKDVWPAMAAFLNRHDQTSITAAPDVVQEMFNNLMCTPFGDDLEKREQMLLTLEIIRDFGDTVSPFTPEVLKEAVKIMV